MLNKQFKSKGPLPMPKSIPIPSAEQAGDTHPFTAWRQSKQFVVGGPLQSREELRANARELRQRIAPESAWGRLVRRVSLRGLGDWLLRKVKPAKSAEAHRRFVANGQELVFLSDEMQPLSREELKANALMLRRQILGEGGQ